MIETEIAINISKESEARRYGQELIERHSLDYELVFDNAKKRAGMCNYNRKQISISRNLLKLNDINAFNETVLHEIAHAIVGPEHGHNEYWRQTAISIGCSGSRTHSMKLSEPKYWMGCISCNTSKSYERLPNKYKIAHLQGRLKCGSCGRQLTIGRNNGSR